MSDISRIVDKMYTKIQLEKPFKTETEDTWALYAAHAVRYREMSGQDSHVAWQDVVGTLEQTPGEHLEEVAFQLLKTGGETGEIGPYANTAVNILVAKGIGQADAERYVGGMIGAAKPGDRAEMAKGLMVLAAKMNGEVADVIGSYRDETFSNYVLPEKDARRNPVLHLTQYTALKGESVDGVPILKPGYRDRPEDASHFDEHAISYDHNQ